MRTSSTSHAASPLQEAPSGKAWRSPSPTRFVVPDVIIHLRDAELEPEVVETFRFSLRINPLYQRLATDGVHADGGLSDGERDHIRRYVNRSKLFISNINHARTMRRITACDRLQDKCIRYGCAIEALPASRVATILGIHERTVTAYSQQYVILPHAGNPIQRLFAASLSAKTSSKSNHQRSTP